MPVRRYRGESEFVLSTARYLELPPDLQERIQARTQHPPPHTHHAASSFPSSAAAGAIHL